MTNGITDMLSFFAGCGKEEVKMYRGNFTISDDIVFKELGEGLLDVTLREEGNLVYIDIKALRDDINRIYIRIPSNEREHIIGGGEQFSCLDLKGRSFPIWTREQGVGRNKATEITRLADELDGSGGDYHTTFYPQPTFMSSQMYFVHVFNTEYSVLNFENPDYHEICVWSTSASFVIGSGADYQELLILLTGLLGRQPSLPDWAIKGLWLGVQGGTERALECLEKCRAGGMDISAVWIQDWEGKRITSFGKRLEWDWRWNKQLYPGLDRVIKQDKSLRWMGYINPALVSGGVLFEEAREKGYFVKNDEGEDYLFDFGEFDCGLVDFTCDEAFTWYKQVIKNNLLTLGMRGFMADFGEYLPYDAVAYGGTGKQLHNRWPVLWAKCCREAVKEAGLEGDCVFFMRAGGSESGRYSLLCWAGDQNVDFSYDDGLASVITASITLGMSGFGLHTCDIGGYTTLFHLHRDSELMERWLEYAAFTPVMRTHEGNRPDSNIQLYSDDDMIKAGAFWVKIHNCLAPYISDLMKINSENGIPVQRGLFMVEPENDALYDTSLFEYMLGDDMIVAPVVDRGAVTRHVTLPMGEWTDLYTGELHCGGSFEVDAPLGKIPVFYRTDSRYSAIFEQISQILREKF